ncbi:NAD(P)H-binding protein [Gordonia sp. MP11Mi]|uniref:NAD(P)-binding domain-containing protein n=1 Tax=Gordonia sp. MP11Mi TaxID=3022769 RepID=A0AA97CYG4_9ACTN
MGDELDSVDEIAARTNALVLGATGYIGSRLVPELLSRGVNVTVGVRDIGKLESFPWNDTVVVAAVDVSEPKTLAAATASQDVVFYLVHSMDGDKFVERDHEAARNVAQSAHAHNVNRIVYLSGLIPDLDDRDLSDHLYSRMDVERVFTESPVGSVTLRAAIVLGAGSASFELLRQLSERVPFVPLPSWLNSHVQPVSIRDVLDILVDVGLATDPPPASIDVGGPDAMKYSELVRAYCATAGLNRVFLPLPFLPHRFVGAMASYFVDLTPSLVQSLIDSLGHDMVCRPQEHPCALGSVTTSQALAASLAPAIHERTTESVDPHALRAHDADWAGGDVEIAAGRSRVTGAATGGVGWRSRRTSVPLVVSAGVVAVGATVSRVLVSGILRRGQR